MNKRFAAAALTAFFIGATGRLLVEEQRYIASSAIMAVPEVVAKRTLPKLEFELSKCLRLRNTKLPEATAAQISQAVVESSNRFGIPQEMVLAVIIVESRGNPEAKSCVGARGLMQIMPGVWLPYLARWNIIPQATLGCLTTIKWNVHAGTYILKHYFERERSWVKALHKYSGGHKGYANKVLQIASQIREEVQ